MKSLVIILLAIVGFGPFVNGQNDGISKYFDQYLEDERFTAVYVSSKLFQMVSRLDLQAIDDIDDKEAKIAMEVLSQLKGLRVLTTEVTPQTFYKEALQRLKVDDYEVLLTVRDEDENVRIWVKDEGEVINELLLLVGGNDEFVLLSLIGNIDLNKISTLSKTLDIEGIEHLDKINKNN